MRKFNKRVSGNKEPRHVLVANMHGRLVFLLPVAVVVVLLIGDVAIFFSTSRLLISIPSGTRAPSLVHMCLSLVHGILPLPGSSPACLRIKSHHFATATLKQGTSRKKILRVERQERAAEDEANFLAKVFHSGMDDWEEVDIFNE